MLFPPQGASSVVRSVLFVLDVSSKPVTSITHATEQGLCEGQNVNEGLPQF